MIETLTEGTFAVHTLLMNGKKDVSAHFSSQLASKLVSLVGQPKGSEQHISNWALFAINFDNTLTGYKAEKARGEKPADGGYDLKLKQALTRLTNTLQDETGAGDISFRKFLSLQW